MQEVGSYLLKVCGVRGAPLVYIPDLVKKVVDLLEENQRLEDHDIHMTQ